MPSAIAHIPIQIVAILVTLISSAGSHCPFLQTLTNKSWLIAPAPVIANPETTAKIVANATAQIKP